MGFMIVVIGRTVLRHNAERKQQAKVTVNPLSALINNRLFDKRKLKQRKIINKHG